MTIKERDSLGAELKRLQLRAARELGELEFEDKPEGRRIILVAGVEYPRYAKNKQKTKKGEFWVLSGGRTIPERPSHWRMRCENLAKQRLTKDPDLVVFLYDFDKALQERVTLDKGKGKLAFKTVRKFPELVDSDYRRVDGDKLLPISADPLDVKTHTKRPYIRYCPGATAIDKGEVSKKACKKKHASTKWSKLGLNIQHVY
jgi:hypothetical protein